MYMLLWPSPHIPRVGATGAGDMQPPHLPWCTLGCLPPQEFCKHGRAVQGRGRLCVFPCALQRKWPQGHFVQLGGSVGTPAPPQESPGADSNGDVVTVRMRATHVASRLRYIPQGLAQGRGWLHVAGSPLLGGPGGTLAQQAAMAPTTGTRCWAGGCILLGAGATRAAAEVSPRRLQATACREWPLPVTPAIGDRD